MVSTFPAAFILDPTVEAEIYRVRQPGGRAVILLAGQRYREFIEPWLRERGHPVSIPLEGLPIGKQLQWLKQHR